MTARDSRYGRRGGGWVDHQPGELARELEELRAAAGGDLRRPVDRVEGQLSLFGDDDG